MDVDMRLPEERVAILDAGSQFGKVIDRRVRELNIYCEVCIFIFILFKINLNHKTQYLLWGLYKTLYSI